MLKNKDIELRENINIINKEIFSQNAKIEELSSKNLN